MNYLKFPQNKNEIIDLAKEEHLTIIVKCSKGVDLDFNPQGLFFGSLWSSTGEYEEIIFSTSEWNACQDYYQGFDVYPKEYQGQHEINWTIEDIEEYVLL